MSSFVRRWVNYGPVQEKASNTPKVATAKTDRSTLVENVPQGQPLGISTLPRLPWQLEHLLSAASSNALEVELPGVLDVGRYALAWGSVYLTGDKDEALSRLWQVYRAWQGVN